MSMPGMDGMPGMGGSGSGAQASPAAGIANIAGLGLMNLCVGCDRRIVNDDGSVTIIPINSMSLMNLKGPIATRVIGKPFTPKYKLMNLQESQYVPFGPSAGEGW